MKLNVTRCALLTLILLAAGALPAAAQSSAGGASLFITPSARADGMGRAFVSIADDASAVWWNPAGLAFIKEREAMTNYAKLVPDLADDVFYLYLGYVQPSKSWGTLGGNIVYLSYGQNQITRPNDNGVSDSVGTFTSYEVAPTLSFGTSLSDVVGVGFSVKFLYVNLAPGYALQESGIATSSSVSGTGSSVAVDFGILAKPRIKMGDKDLELGIGAMVQNLGPSISFVDQANSDPLPRNIHIGVSGTYHIQKGYSATFAANLQQPIVTKKDHGIWHVGAEALLAGTLAGRVGYIYDSEGDITAPTFGLGVYLNQLQIDFASVPQATGLARVKKFALGVRF
jgi:hypothetical protein